VAPRSFLTLRVEDGDRRSRPISIATAGSLATTSDTGALTAELQTSAGRVTAFGRFSRRENVDSAFTSATFTQNDTMGQALINLSRSSQLFGPVALHSQHSADGAGSTFLQIGGGAQQRIFRQGLWLRVEGNATRNEDLVSGALMPRDAFTVGLNGQLAAHTTIGLNVYADRAPIGAPGDPSAWLTRSTIRIVHTIPTGSVRVGNA